MVNRARKMQFHSREIRRTQPNYDLWIVVQDLLTQLGDSIQVLKIDSHQDVTVVDHFEAWVLVGNEAADRAAARSFDHLPARVVEA